MSVHFSNFLCKIKRFAISKGQTIFLFQAARLYRFALMKIYILSRRLAATRGALLSFALEIFLEETFRDSFQDSPPLVTNLPLPNSSHAPTICQMHIQFCKSILLAHSAWISLYVTRMTYNVNLTI